MQSRAPINDLARQGGLAIAPPVPRDDQLRAARPIILQMCGNRAFDPRALAPANLRHIESEGSGV
jgi:hypothetical protein